MRASEGLENTEDEEGPREGVNRDHAENRKNTSVRQPLDLRTKAEEALRDGNELKAKEHVAVAEELEAVVPSECPTLEDLKNARMGIK